MDIKFFFEYGHKLIQLPVNPPSVVVQSPGTNKTAELVTLGEINILREKALKTIEFTCFFPADTKSPLIAGGAEATAPKEYVTFFENIRKDKKPCRLIITGVDINMQVSIEDFQSGISAGDDDLQYSISFKEYREFTTKLVKAQVPASSDGTDNYVAQQEETRAKTGFAIGDKVAVTGYWWYTSYGDTPRGQAPQGFIGKISHLVADTNRKYRYHITDIGGGYKGWVGGDQITHAG